ncbi:hypothetical protein VPNG_09197 [Cytospora leucostoma]|uniref:Uncharacterized protein n=1 Tax=Cytospora leucostoma TaxID=1230097 RepID=A0A423VUF2_9PEZI|nr:hypothetical protein VPNG_09197 [Cytospora leucostoma]
MVKPPAKTWGFTSLPAELRLQILANTHLGPPSTGGYDPSFGVLQVRDGRARPNHYHPQPWDGPEDWPKCTSPETHGTHQPQCRCRIIPTQLFTVSRQTSTEALEVFYTNLHLDLDPCSSVTFFRSLSPQNIHRLRRLTFFFTPVQVQFWCDGAATPGYPELPSTDMEYYREHAVKPPDQAFYRRTWREVIALLAAHADLPRLSLTIDMSEGTWAYVETPLMWAGEIMEADEIVPMFRFIYDHYIDVFTALCELRGLGALEVEIGAFDQLKPWLEREVLGRESPEPKYESKHKQRMWEELWKRPRWFQRVPPWHDMDRRLEGSNYRPT